MKRTGKLTALITALIITCAMLASCGGSSGLEDDPAVGSWTMTEVEYMGQTLSAEDLQETGAMTEMPVVEIRDNGSCTFQFMEQSGEGEVTPGDDGTYTLTDDSDTTLNFEIDDEGKLRLDYSAMSMVMIFEKQS